MLFKGDCPCKNAVVKRFDYYTYIYTQVYTYIRTYCKSVRTYVDTCIRMYMHMYMYNVVGPPCNNNLY